MNFIYIAIYFLCFALIAGGAFAMMWANINSAWRRPVELAPTHPESPAAGEKVLYVDLKREQLEHLFKQSYDDN